MANQGNKGPTAAELQKQLDELKKMIASQNSQAASSTSPSFAFKPTPAAEQTGVDGFEFYSNKLDLPEKLKKEMRDKGYDFRFINIKKYKEDGGIHKAYWRPYIPEAGTVQDDIYGRSPEGYVVRGDAVLAVRSQAQTKSHKDHLKLKNLAYSQYEESAKQDLQKMLKGTGLEKTVKSGYDE